MVSGELIKRNFSKYASSYDQYASIQKLSASHLLSLLEGIKEAPRILEIGCGTGNYTQILSTQYPDASILAYDPVGEMIALASNKYCSSKVTFTDQEPFFNNAMKFHLITSNAVFHWMEEPSLYLQKASGALLPGGTMAFSAFGPLSYQELSLSLKKHLGQEGKVASECFLDLKQWEGIAKISLKELSVTEKIFHQEFPDLKSLLKCIKYTGTRGGGNPRKMWTAKTLEQISHFYLRDYGKIRATYQIFFIRGKRK